MSDQPDKAPLIPAAAIQVLPEGIANRIAAGEVVERPASVVKELVENALDADATRITISVKKAGMDEILVADDGWGMDKDDIVLAFRRHATSKIKDANDLNRITHLGFRGEALPSVGSVARVEVITRRDDRESGFRYLVEGGKPKGPEPAARERGTTVKVRTLFYNVPARRKFLRAPSTEYRHIYKMFTAYTLAYPEIHWTLEKDGKTERDLPPADLKERIVALFGEKMRGELHEVDRRVGDVFVSGFIGGSGLFKSTRASTEQLLFVNRRPFQEYRLTSAVSTGYGPLIRPGQHPFFVLFLRMDPEEFDVNVHPAKHEVRFRDDGLIFVAVKTAVREALGLSIRDGGAPVQASSSRGGKPGAPPPRPEARKIDGVKELELLFGKPPTDRSPRNVVPPPRSEPSQHTPHNHADATSGGDMMRKPVTALDEGKTHADPLTTLPHETAAEPEPSSGGSVERTKVWQLHKTYILSQVKSGLVIIDQHVAHERILFERALASMKERPWSGQQLLFPVVVSLDPAESGLLEDLAPKLLTMGLEVEPFGGHDWAIKSLPTGVRIKGEEKLLREILADFQESHEVQMAPEERLAASFACKAAIKAGDPLNLEEMNALIDELFQTEYPFVCPHGRPVVVNLSLSDLHKMFGRE